MTLSTPWAVNVEVTAALAVPAVDARREHRGSHHLLGVHGCDLRGGGSSAPVGRTGLRCYSAGYDERVLASVAAAVIVVVGGVNMEPRLKERSRVEFDSAATGRAPAGG